MRRVPRSPLLAALAAVAGCGAAGAPATAHTVEHEHGETHVHVDARPEVHVEVRPEMSQSQSQSQSAEASAGAGGGHGHGDGAHGGYAPDGALVRVPEPCPGLSVHERGETRSGRKLGMAILQVYARPSAELLVDGVRQGETPLVSVGVDTGPRDVTLRNTELGYECTVRLTTLPGGRYSVVLDVERGVAAAHGS